MPNIRKAIKKEAPSISRFFPHFILHFKHQAPFFLKLYSLSFAVSAGEILKGL